MNSDTHHCTTSPARSLVSGKGRVLQEMDSHPAHFKTFLPQFRTGVGRKLKCHKLRL